MRGFDRVSVLGVCCLAAALAAATCSRQAHAVFSFPAITPQVFKEGIAVEPKVNLLHFKIIYAIIRLNKLGGMK